MGTIIQMELFKIRVGAVVKPQHSGTLISYNAHTRKGVVQMREDPKCFIGVFEEDRHAYVPINKLRRWREGEDRVEPKRGDWIILDAYPCHSALVQVGGPRAFQWGLLPAL